MTELDPARADASTHDTLDALRTRMVRQLWGSLLIIALIGVPLSLLRSVNTGWLPLYTVHLVLGTMVLAGFLLQRRLNAQRGAVLIVLVFWTVGLAGLLSLGPMSAGAGWLVTSALLAAIIFSPRAGLITLAGVSACILLIAFAFVTGHLSLPLDINAYASKPASWAMLAIGTLGMPALVLLAVTDLYHSSVHLTQQLSEHGETLRRSEAQLAESTERITQIVATVPCALLVVDGNGRIVEINHLAEKLFRATAGELVGKAVEDLIPEELRTEHLAKRLSLSARPAARAMGAGSELPYLTAEGTTRTAEISLAPFQRGDQALWAVWLLDVTERKRAEEEREALKAFMAATRHQQGQKEADTMCVFCKNVKAPDGTWEDVETYLHERLEIGLSHGYCPPCVREHYPEMADAVLDAAKRDA